MHTEVTCEMSARQVLVVLCIWVVLAPGTLAGSPIWFTVHTRRSPAGQWQAEVDIQHGVGVQDLTLTHYTHKCEDAHKAVRSKTTVTADEDISHHTEGRSCQRPCPTPMSESVSFMCGSSPCIPELHPSGARVSMKCKPGYNNRNNISTEIVCMETGDWSGPQLDCVREPSGYTFFPELGWYQLYMIGNTYKQAKRICEFDGGNLGIVDTPGELEAFQQLINASTASVDIQHQYDIYVGVKRHDGHEEYVNLQGRPMTASYYFKWCAGRPPALNQHGDCTIYAKQMNCHWDSSCNRKLAFLCEIPIKY